MDFSEEEEALVRESWEVMQQDIPKYSLRFFTLILEIAPSAKSLFSYMNNSDELPHDNPQLKAHATVIFKMISESAVQLREKGEAVVPDITLDTIAAIHHERGVMKSHFPIMGAALLKTIKEAVGDEKWSDEMEEAWTKSYDELSHAIIERMQAREGADEEAPKAAS